MIGSRNEFSSFATLVLVGILLTPGLLHAQACQSGVYQEPNSFYWNLTFDNGTFVGGTRFDSLCWLSNGYLTCVNGFNAAVTLYPNPDCSVITSSFPWFTLNATGDCSVSDLSPLDSDAIPFEASAPYAPTSSLFSPQVEGVLDQAMSNVTGPSGITRTSGYRPLGYQAHLYELRTKMIAYRNATHADSGQVSACAALKQKLDNEIYNIHHLKIGPAGLPLVNKPASSLHTDLPSNAVDAGVIQGAQQLKYVDQLARTVGVIRPCHADVVHFALAGAPCNQTLSATSQSPVSLLIIDPLGHKIGFDPVTKQAVNDLGPDGFYSGPGTEPEVIDVHRTYPGQYLLIGTGTGDGPYLVTLTRMDDDEAVIKYQNSFGTATTETSLLLTDVVAETVPIDIKPGSYSNPINLSSNGTVPVAILSTAAFDATGITTSSLRFGHTGTESSLAFCSGPTDINGDGRNDVVCHFFVQKTALLPDDSQALLTGQTKNGLPIEGLDVVSVLP